jgi:hypothetical protein
MDETLLHTSEDSEWGVDGGLIVAPRPGLKRFLDAVNLMGYVWVLSAGTPEYIPEALAEVGIESRICGWRSSRLHNNLKKEIIGNRPWVLVDDRPANTSLTQTKLHQCGGPGDHSDHLVLVEAFTGDASDRVLHGLPGLIGLNLALQVESSRR